MLYESMLLFGVVFIAAWLFSTLLQQRNALSMRYALQYWLFLVLGAYFVWFWTHGGQTLAMKTWRIRLIPVAGLAVSPLRALMRLSARLVVVRSRIGDRQGNACTRMDANRCSKPQRGSVGAAGAARSATAISA